MCEGMSNTNSGSKRGVQCRDTTISYLAFIIRNLFLNLYKNRITIKINIVCFKISKKI
ncbi:MAG: hypothetical protein K0S93_789 [Nitrososphaeraceae archaeon]|jgi:hypothetical protein|nr:hypothetical protein [Nitrososphaeraceae archaeon]